MALTAFQIANKLIGTENQATPTFETPTQAIARMPKAQQNQTNGDAEYTPAKAAADARVTRRQQGKES